MDRYNYSTQYGGDGAGHAPDRDRDRGAAYGMHDTQAQRSLSDLFRELGADAQLLVHQEVQLAKTEINEKLSAFGKHSGFIVGGGLVAYAGLIISLMAVGFLLGSFMPNWLGFMIAGLVVVLVGTAFLIKGRNGLQKTNMGLEKTTESMDESKRWVKEEASDVKKDPAHLGSHK